MRHFLRTTIFCIFSISSIYGDTVVWSGNLSAKGEQSPIVPLTLGKHYRIKVSGTMNLGKWWQQGKPLEDDACYEFNDSMPAIKIDSFKNSLHIHLGDGKYHPDHLYQSELFTAAQEGVHFWIYDTDYSDNSGSLHVEVIEVSI